MLRAADWTRFVDSRIEAHATANAWQHDATLEAVGQALAEIKKQLRGEILEQCGLLRADFTVATKHAAIESREAEVVSLMRRSPRRA